MQSLKILVGGSFPFIGGPENEKKFLKNFEIFLSPTTFRPEMLERWNSVFRAKWVCWEEIRPGGGL